MYVQKLKILTALELKMESDNIFKIIR